MPQEQWSFAPSNDWNSDIVEDLCVTNLYDLVVYSRDWTVETIISQIRKKNIDLNPAFQRRNAWDDRKRSLLIESLIVGIPVPEIVLAEDPKRRRSFMVLDGKQRLLTISGFANPKIGYWDKARLQQLRLVPQLNNLTFDQLQQMEHVELLRAFMNADIRCTVVSNYTDDDVLYSIFYRLNTGSVPLEMQELRQALNKGPFADHLITMTSTPTLIHKIMETKGPDNRLRDVELLLRFFSMKIFPNRYHGNLKAFLDTSMRDISENWSEMRSRIDSLFEEFNDTEALMALLFEDIKQVGRRIKNGRYLKRFNKALFEVECYYFHQIRQCRPTTAQIARFREKFQELCETSDDFRRSIETTTKSIENYNIRFRQISDLINETLDQNISPLYFES